MAHPDDALPNQRQYGLDLTFSYKVKKLEFFVEYYYNVYVGSFMRNPISNTIQFDKHTMLTVGFGVPIHLKK